MRFAHILFAAAALFTVACAAPDEAADWNAEVATHEAALESRVERAAETIDATDLAEEETLVAVAEPTVGGDDGEVAAKKVPTRVEISRDHIHVEWNDGTESDYCFNQETGQYEAC